MLAQREATSVSSELLLRLELGLKKTVKHVI